MSIDFQGLSKTPHVFRQLAGLTVSEFEEVIKRLGPS